MTYAIIIDANMFGRDMRTEIESEIENNGLKVIGCEGSKLNEELLKSCRERYVEYVRSGRLLDICNDSVSRKIKNIEEKATIRSNDAHIIAIAIAACANTLVTNEKNDLIADFKDIRKLNREAGCMNDNRLGSRTEQKVIRKSSPSNIMRILKAARSRCNGCECMINGGGY